ncbi:MAG TPA: tRNA-guanine transglycosylase [Streptosporangiaceae bacterium]|nr:tRNA-guanine transglycosylase [Streptosporangiaceae bacterium]
MTQAQGTRPGRTLVTPSGRELPLPLFLPVHQANSVFGAFRTAHDMDLIRGCICNAFFLYKQADLRALLTGGTSLHEYLGFDGLVMTDSGAFQQFSRALYLSNRKIVEFQRAIGADVVSPLDVVTSPGDSHTVALRKVDATARRVMQAQRSAEGTLLAGVQQGGRFLDLRQRSTEQMVELGVAYLALGSLVPFFTRAHDLRFVAKTLRATRAQVPDGLPIHIYGAGDPLELPFFAYLGADVFDSASYAHYARSGWYMTPFGAVRDPGLLTTAGEGFSCGCPPCRENGSAAVFADPEGLSFHNLWTVLTVTEDIRAALAGGTLAEMLERVLRTHAEWFPDSPLPQHWDELHG